MNRFVRGNIGPYRKASPKGTSFSKLQVFKRVANHKWMKYDVNYLTEIHSYLPAGHKSHIFLKSNQLLP